MLSKRQRVHSAIILDKIYADGPCSRVDLSRELNITPATMSDITQFLIDENVLHEVGEDNDNYRAGRRKILLDIFPDHSYLVGVEVFDSYIAMCLTNNVGTIIKQRINEHRADEFFESFTIEQLIETLTQFIHEDCKNYSLTSIGVAVPGKYNQETGSLHTHHPFWKTFSFKPLIEAFDLPVLINDIVKCLSYSQRIFAKDRKDENFIFIHVRHKIIAYCMYEGAIFGDANAALGEIGHTVINPHGEVCICGKRGCLQTYMSEQSMIRKAQMIYENSTHTFFHHLVKNKSEIDMDVIIKAYKLGDEAATTIINSALNYLAHSINNYAMMLDAKNIFIHGLIFNAPDFVDILEKNLKASTSTFPSHHPIESVIIPYDQMNAAVGAVAYCISEHLMRSYSV